MLALYIPWTNFSHIPFFLKEINTYTCDSLLLYTLFLQVVYGLKCTPSGTNTNVHGQGCRSRNIRLRTHILVKPKKLYKCDSAVQINRQ